MTKLKERISLSEDQKKEKETEYKLEDLQLSLEDFIRHTKREIEKKEREISSALSDLNLNGIMMHRVDLDQLQYNRRLRENF